MGSDYFVKISDIAVVFDGPHATPTKIDAGPYFLSISSLEKGMLDLSKSAHLSDEQFDKWTKRVTPQEGDVLFSYETRLGEAALMPAGIKACLGRRMGLLRPNREKVIPEYLLFAYLSPGFQQEIKKRTIHGATVDRIALKEFPDFNIRIPPLNEQKRVVDILNSINGKLAVNRQINQTLEQMAQALFKSWFVDFDPVVDNALDAGFFEQNSDLPEELLRRAEQRKIVREQPDFKPLPAETRLLFPAAFEECEEPSLGLGGWVPKGWDLGHLSDIAGYGSKRVDVLNLTVDNYISTENMLPDRKGVQPASNLPTLNSVPAYTNRYVLISNIRPYFKKIWLASGYGGYSNDVLGFESKSVGGECFLFNLLSQDVFFDFMMATSKGSKMPRGDKKAILNWGIVIPPLPLCKSFSENVSDFYESITHRNNECNILSQLRDTLLPKLISGELRLSDDGTLASGNTDC
ncbi:restriction endonuclease subunit S [Plesiomonas shigelloides]|uniref:restriction endonuclease subunit S n=1 Tax=Plesiomonas shigelloides TaxID=703 RepID=UPI000907C7D2|nr:restriction endonuclease subunit S [Plesiomonas shigelloides]